MPDQPRRADPPSYDDLANDNQRLRALLGERASGSPRAESRVDTGFMAGGGEMGALMREMDWSPTSFGPVAGWSQALRAAVSICLTTRFPIVLYYGPDLALIYNDAWRPVVGNKHPWSFGRAGREVWSEIWDIIGPMFQTVMDTGEATWSNDQLLPLNRFGYVEECYFYYSYSPIRGEGGRVEGIFTAVAETTDRVISDRRTQLLRDLAAGALNAKTRDDACAVAAQVLAGDPHDVPFAFVYLDDGHGRLSRAAAVGTAGPDAFAPADVATDEPDADPWRLRAVRHDGQAALVEDLDTLVPDLPRDPWPEAPCQAYVLPIGSPGAGTVGVAVLGISARRRFDARYRSFCEQAVASLSAAIAGADAYQEERRRAERLAELDHAKTAFFSNVSHEFRTPLTLMLSPLEEVLAKPGPEVLPDNRALVDVAHRNGLRLLRLVNGLLDFSRVEAGRASASFEPVDLAAFTAELASNFRSLCEGTGLALAVDCPALDEPVYVDRDMWEKVVLNLLSNAFKFTFEGRIAVRVAQEGPCAVLSVADTGTGIAAEELPKLFERFHRIEGARGRTFEGSGIGLALVQELVRLHGGSLKVDSEPGRGSTFTVSVPFGRDHLPAEAVGAPRAGTSTAVRAEAFVEEARRWVGDDAPALRLEEVLSADAPTIGVAPGGGRVLLADDNADMREHVRRLLTRQGYAVETVPDGQAALEAARRAPPDLVLTDVMMPRLNGFGLLGAVRADPRLRDLPVVMLSARAGDEAKVEGLDAGADDYLTKPFSARELLARVGTNLQLARARREAAEALRRANETLESEVAARTAERDRVWQVSHDMLCVADSRGVVISANPAWTRVLGWSPADVVGRTSEWLEHPDDRAKTRAETAMLAGGRTTLAFENRFRAKDDGYRTLSWTAVPEGGLLYCVARDVTEQRAREAELAEVEQALRQAQKMEAVGQLTGGIAHDFNNLLTGIIGSLDLMQTRISQGRTETIGKYARAASSSASRAAALTHRLLAFARRQPLDLAVVDANALVTTLEDLLRRTIGEAVHLEVVKAGGLWATLCDPHQLENAIINLCINARDAMPRGGRLTVETANAHLDRAYARQHPDVAPGQFVCVSVTDTGTGMPPEVAAKAFEPFFTTKPAGQGTGLGLSMIYGFAKQSQGHAKIYSEAGRGTTIKVYLPRAEGEAGSDEAVAVGPAQRAEAGETVLIVEDDPVVRDLVVEVLQDLGYRALEAMDGPSGLRILQSDRRIDLLVSDVGLPGLNGREMVEQARADRPGLKVLFITGYAENAMFGVGALEPGMQMITKPFAVDALALRIREMIEG